MREVVLLTRISCDNITSKKKQTVLSTKEGCPEKRLQIFLTSLAPNCQARYQPHFGFIKTFDKMAFKATITQIYGYLNLFLKLLNPFPCITKPFPCTL